MAAPYTSQSSSGYNDNPPADDGSQVATNKVLWSTIKTKLSDVLKTFAENINSAVAAAFPKVVGGAGVTSSATSYQVLSADQGKFVRNTGSGTTITTPSATDVGAPFVFAALNNHASGTCTLDGSGSQTVDGLPSVTLQPGEGCLVYTDGSNWFTIGRGPGSAAALSIASLSAASATLTGAISAATAAGEVVATQANMEAASATNLLVSPGRQHFHPSAAKAWGKFAGATGTLSVSHNITSVVRDSAGDYTVTIATDFSSADYVVNFGYKHTSSVRITLMVLTQAAGSFTIKAEDETGTDIDPEHIFFTCYGDHA